MQGPPVLSPAANKPPIANFAFGRNSPQVGDSVDFVSGAVDPDGTLRSQAWDLDGDGQFDDARGDEVLYTFTTPGAHTVRLRVEDDQGAAAIHERTVTVKRAPAAKAGFLTPAPVIRLNGQLLSSGSRITILSVRAPKGTLVTVKCHGKTLRGVAAAQAREERLGPLQDLRALPARRASSSRSSAASRRRSARTRATRSGPASRLRAPTAASRPGKNKPVAPLLLTVPICTSGANR